MKKKESIWCKWDGLEGDEIKLNAYGAVIDTEFGFGGILRNNHSAPLICYNGKEGSESILEHELRGIQIGLKVVVNLGFSHIAIASDSSLVVSIIAGSKTDPWYLRNIVNSIKLLCNIFVK